MKTSTAEKWIGTRTKSKLAALVILVSSLAVARPLWASNPWGRAVGEAQCLYDVTEDLRNRAHRLCPDSQATALTCALDESAYRLRESVKCGADWGQIQCELHAFQELQTCLCREIAIDVHLARDRGIKSYLRMVEDRFGDLVRDLSKCKPPVPSCRASYPSHDHPSIPKYWQGSLPRDAYYPRSTYDYETLSPNHHDEAPTVVGKSVPVDRPVSADILRLLLSRALR